MSTQTNVTPLHAGDAELRERLRVAMASDRRLSQASVAREIGISPSALNQWLKGIYPGDNEAIETKLIIWMVGYDERRQAGDAMPVAPAWIETPTAARIVGALSYAQAAGDIAIVYGGAGLGKSTTIRHYQNISLNVWHVTMTPASASVVTALEEICAALGVAESGGAARLHRAIVRRVRGSRGLLAIDEAQHLSMAALDQIRAIHDATDVGVALVGNQEIYARMTGGNRAAYLDRLYSRIGKRLALRASSDEDIQALIAAWNIDDAVSRKTLTDIAHRPGALRTLTKVLRLAGMYALADGKPLSAEFVGRAWRELGGAQ